jgi:AraC-like DNA-binding protein
MSEALNLQTPPALLAHWSFIPTQATVATVLPDGCCDLIFKQGPTDAGQWFISALADTAYRVPSEPGARFEGFRFQPGAHINAIGLLAAIVRKQVLEQAQVFDLIDQFVRRDDRISQALSALANTSRIPLAARACGVSERSLERLVKASTGRTPSHWKSLARVRRTAASLAVDVSEPTPRSLADIAAAQGYADQAHLQREFKRWFGVSPAHMRRNKELLRTACAAGYG